MVNPMTLFRWLLTALGLLLLLLLFLVWFLTWHPQKRFSLTPSNGLAPPLPSGAPLKVLSWNVQYMAGKNYVFFYDLLNGSGPHTRPTSKDIATTLREVARVIRQEDPDIVLLQEVDDGARRSDGEDQLAQLLELLEGAYPARVSTFYWKARFVPHPKIMGSVGTKLALLSKYRIARALHHSLPLMPGSWIEQQFNLKRAVLEVTIETTEGPGITLFNTHLDAFAQGSDTMERQVAQLRTLFDEKTREGQPWIAGGDFNLLMPGTSYKRLDPPQRAYFNSQSELQRLTERYQSFPSLEQVNGPDHHLYYTHFPNDPAVSSPDRTIDYLFYWGVHPKQSAVLQRGTLRISDHLPLVATFSWGETKTSRTTPH